MKQPRRLWQERIQRRGSIPTDRPWLAFWPKDVDLPRPSQQDPGILLHYAILHGAVEMVDKLLELGADPNLAVNGLTPLHTAALTDQSGVATRLLRGGAGFRAIEGLSPLDVAVSRNHLATLRTMLTEGSPPRLHMASAQKRAELLGHDLSATMLLLAIHGLTLR